MIHADAVNLCRIRATELGGMLLPMTTGMFVPWKSPNSRPVRIGIPGTADLVGIVHGRPTAVEVKVGRDQQRAEQKKFQEAWEKSGGIYVLSRDGDTECLSEI